MISNVLGVMLDTRNGFCEKLHALLAVRGMSWLGDQRTTFIGVAVMLHNHDEEVCFRPFILLGERYSSRTFALSIYLLSESHRPSDYL